jgi:Flp pilus assembly protein TadD
MSRKRQPAELSASTGSTHGDAADEVERAAPADGDAGDEAAAFTGPPADATDDEALAYWRDLVIREPSNVSARRRLAHVLDERGESMLAMEQLQAARAAQPDDVALIVDLANAQIALKKFDVAERELRRALRLEPENGDVHLGLGVISFRRGLYAQAELELRRALELDPESDNAYFYRGEALNQLSRVDEALDMLLRATQLQPANARAYYVMGILYDKKSRPQEAAAMYRKARGLRRVLDADDIEPAPTAIGHVDIRAGQLLLDVDIGELPGQVPHDTDVPTCLVARHAEGSAPGLGYAHSRKDEQARDQGGTSQLLTGHVHLVEYGSTARKEPPGPDRRLSSRGIHRRAMAA